MRLGGFGRIEDYENIRQAGFDYAELDLPELEALPEGNFLHFVTGYKKPDARC